MRNKKAPIAIATLAFLAVTATGILLPTHFAIPAQGSDGGMIDRLEVLETRVAKNHNAIRDLQSQISISNQPSLTPLTSTPAPQAPGPVQKPPSHLNANAYYQKYLDVNGIPILAPDTLEDAVLYRTREIMLAMLSNRPDLRATLAQQKITIALYDAYKGDITQLPELSHIEKPVPLASLTKWTHGHLLAAPSFARHCEPIFIQEFANAIHQAIASKGFGQWLETFAAIQTARSAARKQGIWKDNYTIQEGNYFEVLSELYLLPDLFESAYGKPLSEHDPLGFDLVKRIYGEVKMPPFCHPIKFKIEGTLVDHLYAPIPGVSVTLSVIHYFNDTHYYNYEGLPQLRHVGVTDADGTYVINQTLDRGLFENQEGDMIYTLAFYKKLHPVWNHIPYCSIIGYLRPLGVSHTHRDARKLYVTGQDITELYNHVYKNFNWTRLRRCD